MEKIKKVDEAIKYLDSINQNYEIYDYTSIYANPRRKVHFRGIVVRVNYVDIMDGGPEKQKPMMNILGDLLSTIDFRSMSNPHRVPNGTDRCTFFDATFIFDLQEIVDEIMCDD